MRTAILARTEITSIVGSAVYMQDFGGENREFEVPSLTMMIVTDTQDELFEQIDFQIDIWTKTLPQAVQVERVVRWLFHHDNRTSLGDVNLWLTFIDGRTVIGPGHDRYYGRSLDFRAEPIRSKYLRVAES